MEVHPLIQIAGVLVGPAAASWFGVKGALNGLKQSVRRIEKKIDQHDEDIARTRERVARLEG